MSAEWLDLMEGLDALRPHIERLAADRLILSDADLQQCCTAYLTHVDHFLVEFVRLRHRLFEAKMWRFKGDIFRFLSERFPNGGYLASSMDSYYRSVQLLGMPAMKRLHHASPVRNDRSFPPKHSFRSASCFPCICFLSYLAAPRPQGKRDQQLQMLLVPLVVSTVQHFSFLALPCHQILVKTTTFFLLK
jgi:hypothetical protein